MITAHAPVPTIVRPRDQPPAVLTAIRSPGGRLCKRWSGPASHPVCESYGYGYWHVLTDERIVVRNVHDLSLALSGLSRMSDACVVRGELKPPQLHLAIDNPRYQFRRTLDNFQESPRASWWCLDIDTLPPFPFANALDPWGYAGALAGCLGLPRVPMVYQISGSCGIKAKAGVHFWGLMTHALPNPILARWYASLGADPALAGIVQPHYTAAPLFASTQADEIGLPMSERRAWVVDPVPRGRVGILNPDSSLIVNAEAIAARFQADVDREREAETLKARSVTHTATLSRLNRSGPPPEHTSTLQLVEHHQMVTDYEGQEGAARCECPRHASESKQSLHVMPDGEEWYCFGCQKGGGAWDLASWIVSKRTGAPSTREQIVACLREARS